MNLVGDQDIVKNVAEFTSTHLVNFETHGNTKIALVSSPQVICSTELGHSKSRNNSRVIGFQRHLKHAYSYTPNDISLGNLRLSPYMVEPTLRDLQEITIHLSVIRKSDAPYEDGFPTGLNANEACQIMRYLGEAPNLKQIQIVCNKESYQLIGTMLWYYYEGQKHCIKTNPYDSPDDFETYIVALNKDLDVTFYKHKASNKWWYADLKGQNLFPCSAVDYDNVINSIPSDTILQNL